MKRYIQDNQALRVILALASGLVLSAATAAMAAQPPGKPVSFCGNGTVE